MLIEEFLENSAAHSPDKTALVCGDQRLTYSEVERRANRLARALLDSGVRRGDRVGVCLEHCNEAAIAIFGILKARAVFVMLDYTIKSERFHYILKDCGAAALVVAADKLEDLKESLEASPYLESVFVRGAMPPGPTGGRPRYIPFDELLRISGISGEPAALKRCVDADLAALIYTSGTTGRPKGVMLTHLNMYSAAKSVVSYLENDANDVILNVLRLSYSYGLYQVLTGALVGGTVILERSAAYPKLIFDKIKTEGVTALPLVPTIAALLLQYEVRDLRLPSLRYVTIAGSAMPQRHIRALREMLPHAKLFVMYGQTECKRISYLPPEQLDIRPDSVGIAIPNEEVFIIDEKGRQVGAGIVGELIVRGSHVMKGYWGLPEESKKALRPGPVPGEKVLHTGDLFKMDEAGFLYFVGRRDDIIKTRGEKVSPREIEDVLYAIDGIFEAAVVGAPDDYLGESIIAMVTLGEGVSISEQAILRHCARHLEDFKVPRRIEFRASLPKTDRGKIDHRMLRGQAATQRQSPRPPA